MLTKIDLITKIVDEIAPKYWDDGEYSAITKSRMGEFGVISETMGTIFENSTIYNAIKAKEMLTSTASRYTLLKEAAMYSDLSISNAVPSSISLFLGVPIPYLESNWVIDSTNISFILTADTQISISDIPFLMDYDLKITGKLIDNNWIYSAQYLLTDENSLSTVANPYLVSTLRTYDDIQYLMVNIDVKQLTKSYNYYTIVETEAISLNGIDFKYSDHLAYFNVLYKTATSSTYTLLPKINYLSNEAGAGNYVYYDISTSGKVRIFIPSELNFEFNAELRVDIYTTLGTAGSFVYNLGTVIVSPTSFNDDIDYTGSYFKPVVISDATTQGYNTISTDALRSKIINYKSTLNSLDTETDLNTYFNTLDSSNTTRFIRKRVDVLEKVYTAFMVLKDTYGNTMSTNSNDMRLVEANIDMYYPQTGRRVVKPTKAYTLMSGNNHKVEVIDVSAYTPEQITTIENDTSKLLFGCPYLIMVNSNPQSISFYLNNIDQSMKMSSEYYNSNGILQFIINSISLRRHAMASEDKYTLSLNLIPSSALPLLATIADLATGEILDPTAIKLYGYVYSPTETDSIASYFPITITRYDTINSYFVASAELTTDDYISLIDELRFVDSLYNPGSDTPSDIVVPISDIKLGIGVYFKSADVRDKGSYVDIVPNMTEYGLINVYTNKSDLAYTMINMSRKIRSNLTFDDDNGLNIISYNLSQVPMIKYSELSINILRVSEIIENANTIVTSMLSLVKNNTSIDYKFYATYGKSRYFTVGNTDTILDNLTLSLQFKALLNANKLDNTIVADLKVFIQPLVESVNSISTNSSIYFSNIVTMVENEFKYKQGRLVAFELLKINDYEIVHQSLINNTKDMQLMTKPELLEFVPEFARLPKVNITINVSYV